MTTSYRAPFAADGLYAIDAEIARKLLTASLAAGGDYADLYFEYRASGSFSYEEGLLKSAGRGTSLGLGVRVLKGDATGYAYTESLELDAMINAATTAGHIAAGGGGPPVSALNQKALPDRYPVEQLSLEIPGTEKRHMLRRADQAARAYDARIIKVQASLTEEIREILIATSDGVFVSDRQPLMRMNVSAVAEEGDLRQSGSSGGGGRMGFSYFLSQGKKPEDHGREAARVAIDMLHAKEAPAGEFPVVLAPGDSGILLHEAVGHGLEADFNRKRTSNYTDCIGELVASELVSVVDDPGYLGARGAINIDDEGNDAKPVSLIEKGVLRAYLQDRTSAKHFNVSSHHG
ncbi:MAG: TldD/PmbA family protein, partial [Myxococcota bacterium]